MILLHVGFTLTTLSRRLRQLYAVKVLFALLLIWVSFEIFKAFEQFLRLLDRIEVVVFYFDEFLIRWAL